MHDAGVIEVEERQALTMLTCRRRPTHRRLTVAGVYVPEGAAWLAAASWYVSSIAAATSSLVDESAGSPYLRALVLQSRSVRTASTLVGPTIDGDVGRRSGPARLYLRP